MNDVYRLGRLLQADSAVCPDKTVRLFIFGDFFQLIGSGISWAFSFKGPAERRLCVASANLYSAEKFDSIVKKDGGFFMDGRDHLERINFFAYGSSSSPIHKNEIHLIGGREGNSRVHEHIAAFNASHCIFLSATDGKFALLFHLLVASLSNDVNHYFFTETIVLMLNDTHLVLPDISTIEPIMKCHQASSVTDGVIALASKKMPLYRFSKSELEGHNPHFAAALDSYMIDGNTID